MSDERKSFPLDVALLEAVLDHLPIGAILLDDEGIIRRFNRYEEQLSGRKREKTIGKSFFSDVAPCTSDIELGPKFREGIENNNLDLDIEFSFPYPFNRVPRDVRIRAASVSSASDRAHVVLIEDITSRRQLQRNNAEMMMGLKSMVARWRGSEQSESYQRLAFGGADAFEEEAIVLYADVSGFGSLAARTPPAELFQVVDCQLQAAIEAISRRGGHVDEVNGQGVVGVFLLNGGQRVVSDAVRAAQEVVEASRSALELPFRVGLAVGRVFNGPVGRKEFGGRATVGQPVLTARAIAQVGRGHEIVMEEGVKERLGEVGKTSELRGVVPTGIANPGTLHRLEALELPRRA
ncbi:PAS domain-containing protein [Lujinxingia vulgaris]|uniref:PAS domain-containing protein n=1 Tax=Lujinxingia vulgaris TaxID=2600176 RepID=A0A5C6WZR3_9DELT|nr:PAS domain-containing protein [Lujinxingia vulgaris]TXD34269.1 PAS domain-containing protein [Lujinxingia vulgaris]